MGVEHQLTESEKKFVTKFYDDINKIRSNDDLTKFYADNLKDYERVCKLIEYRQNNVVTLARRLLDLFGDDVGKKTVIDIGAGTGSLGEELLSHGFKTIDGLDISKDMLDLCSTKNIYRNLFAVPLECTPTKDIKENSYDAAISAGCYVTGHIPLETLEELARMVKPGGYIVFSLNDPNFQLNYMEIQGRFMKEGKLQLISMELTKYKREVTLNFEYIYAYQIVFKVL